MIFPSEVEVYIDNEARPSWQCTVQVQFPFLVVVYALPSDLIDCLFRKLWFAVQHRFPFLVMSFHEFVRHQRSRSRHATFSAFALPNFLTDIPTMYFTSSLHIFLQFVRPRDGLLLLLVRVGVKVSHFLQDCGDSSSNLTQF